MGEVGRQSPDCSGSARRPGSAPSLRTSGWAESERADEGEEGGLRALREAEADDGRPSLATVGSAASQSGRSSRSSGKPPAAAGEEEAAAAAAEEPMEGRGEEMDEGGEEEADRWLSKRAPTVSGAGTDTQRP